jgi:putative flippase GtrA
MQTDAVWHQALVLWRSRQFRFVVVGLWNTLAGYLLFVLIYSLFSNTLPYPVLAVLAHVAAVTQSFFCQRWVVYRSDGHWLREYGRFHLTHLGLFLLSLACLTALVEWGAWHPLVAQAVVTAGTAFVSYFAHTFFTFRKARP